MSDFSYQYNLVQFKNKKISTDRLTLEIQSSEITIVLDYINGYNSVADIFFKAELPTLNSIFTRWFIKVGYGITHALPDISACVSRDTYRKGQHAKDQEIRHSLCTLVFACFQSVRFEFSFFEPVLVVTASKLQNHHGSDSEHHSLSISGVCALIKHS